MSTQIFTKFDQYIQKSSTLFTLLSDPNRLSVFAILTYGEFPVTKIYKCLTLKQNLVSHHLKVLRENGLIKSRRNGREIYYSLNTDMLIFFKTIIDKVIQPVHSNYITQ